MLTGFWWGNMKGRDHLEDLKMDVTEMGWRAWGVAQGNGRWCAFVKMVMNCQVTYNAWNL